MGSVGECIRGINLVLVSTAQFEDAFALERSSNECLDSWCNLILLLMSEIGSLCVIFIDKNNWDYLLTSYEPHAFPLGRALSMRK